MRKLTTLAIALAAMVGSSQNGLALESTGSVTKNSGKNLSPLFAHYIRGILYDSEKNFDRAIEEYLAAQALDPTVSVIHKKLAVNYLRSARYKEAEEELLIVKKLHPEEAGARWFLAHFYTAQGDFAKAAGEYEQLLNLAPEDSLEILASLADLYTLEEKFEKAVQAYEKILKEKPNSPPAYFNLAIIYTKLEKLKEAEAHFKKALEVDPEYLQAELALGLLKEIEQDLPGAIEHYELALKIDPLNIGVYHRLAQTYYREERIADAIRQYEFILTLNPYDADAFLELSYIYLNEKKPAKSIEIIEQAFAHEQDWKITVEIEFLTAQKIKELQESKKAQAYLILGLAYAQDEQEEKAIQAYEKCIQIQPESAAAYFYLGAIYEQSTRRERAYEALKKSVELDDANSGALNYLGYMYAEDAINLEEAQELIEKALEIEPDNGAYIDSLGWVYFKKGMLPEALAQIEKASKLLEDPEVFEHLGDIYRAKGDFQKATRAWNKALELDPERSSVKEKLEQPKNEEAKNVTR